MVLLDLLVYKFSGGPSYQLTKHLNVMHLGKIPKLDGLALP